MRTDSKAMEILHQIKPGKVYRRTYFFENWRATSRDLKKLVDQLFLRKAGPGLYYKPEKTKYGERRPDEGDVVRNFLRDDDFLLIDENVYTSLVSGLTQLTMSRKVLNKRRHGSFRLGGYRFNFHVRRSFPEVLSREFLLVDLLDSVTQAEDGTPITEKVLSRLAEYDPDALLKTAEQYGNRSTERFLREVLQKQ